jgi:hypothetical protein
MIFTKHFSDRMNQRGITQDMINLVLEYGEDFNDRIILTKKRLKKLVRLRGADHKMLVKLLDKGGLTVVLDGQFFITTYNCNFNNNNRLVA